MSAYTTSSAVSVRSALRRDPRTADTRVRVQCRGGVASLVGLNAEFGLSPEAPEAERRHRGEQGINFFL